MKLNGRAVIYAVRISLYCAEAWNLFLLQELRGQDMWTGMLQECGSSGYQNTSHSMILKLFISFFLFFPSGEM